MDLGHQPLFPTCTPPSHTSVSAVDIREINEVREGTDSRDFERQQVELKKIDQFCFVIYYTSEFKSKSLSVAGMSAGSPPKVGVGVVWGA